jgi:DNA-binding MarR family transcriptional regulator
MLAKEILRIIPASIRTIRRLSTGSLDGSITIHHLRVLLLVKEGQGQTQMAETFQVSLAAVSKMVNGLVSKDLIKRSPGKDGRCLNLNLTSKGIKTLGIVLGQVEERLESSLNELTPTEVKQLKSGLAVLDKLMNLVNEV